MDGDDTSSNPLPPLNKSTSRLSLDEGVSWFHGKITRDAAEHILKTGESEEGLFLVRESTTSPGDYVLSLVHKQSPVHYQIRRHGDDAFFSIDDGPVVHGLEMLISYYQEDAQGLSTKLGNMCKGQPPPADTRRHGRTNLLHRATKEGELTVVSELLKSGYHNLDAKNQEGQTAVHLASMYGFDDILDVLLKNGANPNIIDGIGLSPLHYACQNNQHSTVKVLLYNGANPQLRAAGTGWVPLHDAASRGYVETIKMLLEMKIPCHPRSDYNETPHDVAVKNSHLNCATVLETYVPPKPETCRSNWYHGNLDREKAMQILRNKGFESGMFLVRKSVRRPDIYVLTMVYGPNTYNYEIQRHNRFYFIDDGPYLESLEHVIDHYSRTADGLPIKLTNSIPPELPSACVKEPRSTNQEDEVLSSEHIYNNTEVIHNSKRKFSSSTTTSPVTKQRPNLIRRESLKIGQPVGEGEFGSVLMGKWLNCKNLSVDVAIKTLRDEHMQNCRDEFIREVEVMVGLDHHCIVKLIGVCLGPPLMMVQELLPMGSLLDFLLDYPSQVDPNFDMNLWSAQIAWGMMYLEQKRFVHRDLALRNILLASKLQAKISDFGLSRALGAGSEYYRASSGGMWPLRWYAPESINFGTFSHASDVWSYGVTLWEIFTYGEPPYGEMSGSEVAQLLEAEERLPKPQKCSDHIHTLMARCWHYEPERRPSFGEIFEIFCSDPAYLLIHDHISSS